MGCLGLLHTTICHFPLFFHVAQAPWIRVLWLSRVTEGVLAQRNAREMVRTQCIWENVHLLHSKVALTDCVLFMVPDFLLPVLHPHGSKLTKMTPFFDIFNEQAFPLLWCVPYDIWTFCEQYLLATAILAWIFYIIYATNTCKPNSIFPIKPGHCDGFHKLLFAQLFIWFRAVHFCDFVCRCCTCEGFVARLVT